MWTGVYALTLIFLESPASRLLAIAQEQYKRSNGRLL
jgi:hypothetical protein